VVGGTASQHMTYGKLFLSHVFLLQNILRMIDGEIDGFLERK